MENQCCRQSTRRVTGARRNISAITDVSIWSSIPTPTVPPTAAIADVIGDGIAIAIVSFVVNISMAKLFATKHKYQISPNQVLKKIKLGEWLTDAFVLGTLCLRCWKRSHVLLPWFSCLCCACTLCTGRRDWWKDSGRSTEQWQSRISCASFVD